MAFNFKEGVDPKKPLDPSDPAPAFWYAAGDTDGDGEFWEGDSLAASEELLKDCEEWEKRELARKKKAYEESWDRAKKLGRSAS